MAFIFIRKYLNFAGSSSGNYCLPPSRGFHPVPSFPLQFIISQQPLPIRESRSFFHVTAGGINTANPPTSSCFHGRTDGSRTRRVDIGRCVARRALFRGNCFLSGYCIWLRGLYGGRIYTTWLIFIDDSPFSRGYTSFSLIGCLGAVSFLARHGCVMKFISLWVTNR